MITRRDPIDPQIVDAARHVAVVDQRDLALALKQQAPRFGHPSRVDAKQWFAGMKDEAMCRIGARDVRRGLQIHKDALRSVLEVPAPELVMLVISVDEPQQRSMDNLVPRQTQRLCLRVAHAPATARIQRQPAITMRDVWPL